MSGPLSIADAIFARRSVRTFDGSALSAGDEAFLRAAAAESARPGPFGSAPRLPLLGAEAAGTEEACAEKAGPSGKARASARGDAAKIGTYGVIRGAPAFAALVAQAAEDRALIDAGFAGERFVLSAAARGLGTCWLGGTFSKSSARAAASLAGGEVLVALIAVGRPADRRALLDKLVRAVSGGDSRRPLGALFSDAAPPSDSAEPAAVQADPGAAGLLPAALSAGPLGRLAEALRAAPSASNKQPWRWVFADGSSPRLDLFLARDPRYENLAGYRIQSVDAGIAAAHLELAAAELGWNASRRFEPIDGSRPAGSEFVLGWDLRASS